MFVTLLGGCGKSTSSTEESDQQTDYEAQKKIEQQLEENNSAETTILQESEVSEQDKFGNLLDEFQGEWAQTGSRHSRLVINGKDVNFIYESTIGEKDYCDINTFYFGFDESGELTVVNQYEKPRYNAFVSAEDGLLSIESLIDGDIRTYEKISDNTEVPAEKIEPAISMTADEVRSSTWGAPQKINTTETANGTHEQWVYEGGYIYFENGYVTSIQEVQP